MTPSVAGAPTPGVWQLLLCGAFGALTIEPNPWHYSGLTFRFAARSALGVLRLPQANHGQARQAKCWWSREQRRRLLLMRVIVGRNGRIAGQQFRSGNLQRDSRWPARLPASERPTRPAR